jgi:hypothetical protein
MSGISTNTVKSMIIDSGTVYIDYEEIGERLMGATRDGASFVIEQEVREIPIDGVRGPLLGARRIINEHARIMVNLLEMTKENFMDALFGTASAIDGTDPDGFDVITRSIDFPAESAYKTNVTLIGQRRDTGEDIIFKITNALSEGNFEIETTDDDETSLQVTFAAHFDPADVELSPWEIRIPTQA